MKQYGEGDVVEVFFAQPDTWSSVVYFCDELENLILLEVHDRKSDRWLTLEEIDEEHYSRALIRSRPQLMGFEFVNHGEANELQRRKAGKTLDKAAIV